MKKTNKPVYAFTDFDGTITIKDIGDEIFKKFGVFEPYNSLLKKGELEIETYWQILFDKLDATKEEIENYALEAEIDPYFKKFVDFCREKNVNLTIVSDGFDIYIDPILNKLGVADIPVFKNAAVFEEGKFKPVYPYASESCKCPSASCKRNEILSVAPDEAFIIYIGDGYSDFCAAEHSDVVFAKKELAAHCSKNKIPHYPYSSFFDVIAILEKIIERGELKTRRQAQILRRKAFIYE